LRLTFSWVKLLRLTITLGLLIASDILLGETLASAKSDTRC